MSNVRIIGDIHGKNYPYVEIVESSPFPTVQVGDYGAGFVHNPISFSHHNVHRFIRGNHDNPAQCKAEANWIPDGTIEGNIGYIGGANSIDRAWRTEGVDWWPDEQLSIKELNNILDKFSEEQPEILITHECPEFVSSVLVESFGGRKFHDDNRTRMMLEQLYSVYKPKLHIFGHWHYDFDWYYQGTRFICLDELSYIDIDTKNPPDLESELVSYHMRKRKR